MSAPQQSTLHWSIRMKDHSEQLKFLEYTGDMGYFNAVKAAQLVAAVDHSQTLVDALGGENEAAPLNDTLKKNNLDVVKAHEDAFENVRSQIDDISADKDAVGHSQAWRERLQANAEQQKKNAADAIDKATDAAIAAISDAPPQAQEAAANLWIAGSNIVSDVINACLVKICAVVNSVIEWFKGLIATYVKSVADAWNAVKETVGWAVSKLTGIFGIRALPAVLSSASGQSAIHDIARRLSEAGIDKARLEELLSTVLHPTPGKNFLNINGRAPIAA